ncbi:MAG: leucine-rich repeat domain-containing protein, partial [Clostridia bacterium]|nr:leucine-rich repeat domain-containing protein [Clostridia bacterium]
MKKHLLCILSLVLLLSLFSFVGCNSGKDIHVHKFTTSVVDATCTTAGEKVYICDCGKTDVAEIPALGHSFKDGFCTRCGAVDLDNHEHIWTGPTCTEPQICELCSKTQGEPLGHAVVTDSRVDPTCTETGLTEGSHCSRCGDTLVAQEVIGATGHRYEDSNECNVCGHIDTQYFTFTLLSDDTYEIKAKDVNNIPAHVVIPDFYMDKAVTCIGMHAFAYCNNLQSVAIGINVTSIDFCAFYSCNSLTSIFIPDGVAAIGIGAFGYCKSLGNIQVAENNAMYTDIDGNLYSKDGKVLIQYAIAKQAIAFAIPDGVNTVGSGSFAGCDNLKMVVIPNSVNQIDSQVFYTCTSLTSVIIPNSVTSIGAQAFEGCISLSSIVIGNNVATIGSLAFKYCDSLTNIVIPNSVTTIGSEAFWNCFNLTSIVIGHNIATIEAGAFEYCSALICVYYNGSESKWADINIGTSNTELLSAIYYYSEEHPTTEGNFWHYDENGEIAVWCYNPVIDSAVESTCTETGLTEGSHCSRCGET